MKNRIFWRMTSLFVGSYVGLVWTDKISLLHAVIICAVAVALNALIVYGEDDD